MIDQFLHHNKVLYSNSCSFGALGVGLKPKDFNVYGIHGHSGGLAHEKFAEFLVGHLGTNNDSL
jgi:hypothetical protein